MEKRFLAIARIWAILDISCRYWRHHLLLSLLWNELVPARKISSETVPQEEDYKPSCVQKPLCSSLDKALRPFETSAGEYVDSVKRFCGLVCEMETTMNVIDKPEQIEETPEVSSDYYDFFE